jgi:hypothetical protein
MIDHFWEMDVMFAALAATAISVGLLWLLLEMIFTVMKVDRSIRKACRTALALVYFLLTATVLVLVLIAGYRQPERWHLHDGSDIALGVSMGAASVLGTAITLAGSLVKQLHDYRRVDSDTPSA